MESPLEKASGISYFLAAMSHTELKNVILDLFDQIRGLNARLAEKDRANAEKDRMIASLTGKLDGVIENQRSRGSTLSPVLPRNANGTRSAKASSRQPRTSTTSPRS